MEAIKTGDQTDQLEWLDDHRSSMVDAALAPLVLVLAMWLRVTVGQIVYGLGLIRSQKLYFVYFTVPTNIGL
jgi:hypothetical protein